MPHRRVVNDPDARYTRRLLRARRARPRNVRRRRAAEQRYELAAPHSITSSARASSVGGMVSPSALAVFRLITSSYLVGACTGRSAGFSPRDLVEQRLEAMMVLAVDHGDLDRRAAQRF